MRPDTLLCHFPNIHTHTLLFNINKIDLYRCENGVQLRGEQVKDLYLRRGPPEPGYPAGSRWESESVGSLKWRL